MVIGRILFSMISYWLTIIKYILMLNIFSFFKLCFLWFFLAFSTSYLFFLLCHSKNIAHIRKEIAIEISRSLGFGVLMSTIFIAFYESVIGWMQQSEFFDIHQPILTSLSLTASSHIALYKTMSFVIVLLSALFAHHFVAPLLDCQQHQAVSDRYGYCMLALSLICWIFLGLIL